MKTKTLFALACAGALSLSVNAIPYSTGQFTQWNYAANLFVEFHDLDPSITKTVLTIDGVPWLQQSSPAEFGPYNVDFWVSMPWDTSAPLNIPDGGATIGFVAAGVAGLAMVRRKSH